MSAYTMVICYSKRGINKFIKEADYKALKEAKRSWNKIITCNIRS